MQGVVERIEEQLSALNLKFTQKPIVIGGMAMEYYNMRKSGADIDLVICSNDYKTLSELYPEKRKDIYGDLGVVIEKFEIWRSIALLDYDFYKTGAIQHDKIMIVSLDRLLFMRVCAMDVEKYMNDLKTMKEYYYTRFSNKDFLSEAEKHKKSYEKMNGTVFGGKYEDGVLTDVTQPQSRCGLLCSECGYKESHGCGGCIESNGHPFHGECPIAVCCQDKGFTHCGECEDLPCKKLYAYSYEDKEHGDNPPGARIEMLKRWAGAV